MTSPAVEQFLRHFESVRKSGKDWLVCCPAHEDSRPSLSVGVGSDGRVLLHCFTGCANDKIVSALGLKMSDLYPHDDSPAPVRRKPRQRRVIAPPPTPDPVWLSIASDAYNVGQRSNKLDWLAGNLRVSVDALRDLRIGWLSEKSHRKLGGYPARECYTIPERDGLNRVCGVALRFIAGDKGYLANGHRGLVIPASFFTWPPKKLFAVEGMSDCAAMLTKGCAAVGRASCSHGAKELHHLLASMPNVALVIVTDSDKPGREGGDGVRATVAASLNRDVEIRQPPNGFKDMRAALIGGAL